MSSQLELSAARATLNTVGASGSVAITGTNAVTPSSGMYFYAIQFVEDTVIASDIDLSGATNASFTGFTFPAGMVVYGKWTSVTLTSGRAIGYMTLTQL